MLLLWANKKASEIFIEIFILEKSFSSIKYFCDFLAFIED